MRFLFLFLLMLSVSSLAAAKSFQAPACYGKPNKQTKYMVSFEKRSTGTLVLATHIKGNRYPMGWLSRTRVSQLNPDWTMTKFGAKLWFDYLSPAKKFWQVAKVGEMALTAFENRTPLATENVKYNGYQRSMVEICIKSIYRNLGPKQGVVLSFDSEADLTWQVKVLEDIIWK